MFVQSLYTVRTCWICLTWGCWVGLSLYLFICCLQSVRMPTWIRLFTLLWLLASSSVICNFRRPPHPWRQEICVLTLPQHPNPKPVMIQEMLTIPVESPRTRTHPTAITWVTQVQWMIILSFNCKHVYINESLTEKASYSTCHCRIYCIWYFLIKVMWDDMK